jgi:hypothetical protein
LANSQPLLFLFIFKLFILEMNQLRILIRESISIVLEQTSKTEEKDEDQEIHLPELSMKKVDLVKYLKEVYNLELKD